MRAVGVRGHQFLLKDKAKTYMLRKANIILRNKFRKRRLNQFEYFQHNLVNKYILFENKSFTVDCSIRETFKYFSKMNEVAGLG